MSLIYTSGKHVPTAIVTGVALWTELSGILAGDDDAEARTTGVNGNKLGVRYDLSDQLGHDREFLQSVKVVIRGYSESVTAAGGVILSLVTGALVSGGPHVQSIGQNIDGTLPRVAGDDSEISGWSDGTGWFKLTTTTALVTALLDARFVATRAELAAANIECRLGIKELSGTAASHSDNATVTAYVDSITIYGRYDTERHLRRVSAAAGAGASVGGASQTWATPGEVTALDGVYATQTVVTGEANNDFLEATQFGFAVPTTASVWGVDVVLHAITTAAAFKMDDARLVIGGVKSGTAVSGASFRDGAQAAVSAYSQVTAYHAWGLALTPADVNASNFGFGVRFDNTGTSQLKAFVDAARMRILYDGPPFFDQEVKAAEFDWETDGVTLAKIVRAGSPEFDHECASARIDASDPACEFAREWRSVAITSLSQIAAQGAEFDRKWRSVLVYDPNVQPHRVEFDREIGGTRFFTNSNLSVSTGEWGWEASTARLRYFARPGADYDRLVEAGLDETPTMRRVLAAPDARTLIVHKGE
jgi:hypothetical protein